MKMMRGGICIMERRIQRAYCDYITWGKEKYFQELLELTWAKWKQKIICYLKNKGCFNDETLDDAFCRAEIGIWKAAKNREIPCDVNSTEFCAYSYGIYMNSVKGVVRSYYSKHNQVNVNTISVEQKNEAGVNLLQSRDDDGQFSKRINGVTKLMNTELHNAGYDREKDHVYQRLLYEYFVTLMDVKVVPQKSLALIYSRIIPHLLKEIPDEKASSAKAAFRRMEGKTVYELKVEAERLFQKRLFMDVSFGDAFLEQLNTSICVGDNATLIRDIMYTNIYDEDKIEHWSDDLHRIVIRDTYKRLKEEEEFLGIADRYLKSRNKYCTLIGKKYSKKSRKLNDKCKDK